MAISYIGAGTVAAVASGNLTPGEPSGAQAGDLLICSIGSYGPGASVSCTMSAPWVCAAEDFYSYHSSISVWSCIRGSTAPPYLVTQSGGNSTIARVVAYRGLSGVINGSTASYSSTNIISFVLSGYELTTTVPGCLIFYAGALNVDTTVSSWDSDDPTYLPTTLFQNLTTLGSDTTLFAGAAVQEVAGELPLVHLASSAFTRAVSVTVAFEPASGVSIGPSGGVAYGGLFY